MPRIFNCLLALMLCVPGAVAAASLDEEMASFRKDVLEINKRLLLMEEELLFPADTQLAVFVSLDVGKFFTPDTIELKLDGDTIDSYLYTQREVRALRSGAIQKLHTTNIKNGKHVLTAFVTGTGPGDRDYRRAISLEFEKGSGRQFVHLSMKDDAAAQQPEFIFKTWQ